MVGHGQALGTSAGRTDRIGQCERKGSKEDPEVCVRRTELPFTKTRETVKGAVTAEGGKCRELWFRPVPLDMPIRQGSSETEQDGLCKFRAEAA